MRKALALTVCLSAVSISSAQFSLSLNKSSVAGQNFVQGTITLDSAPSTDTNVTTYDNSSLVTTPPSVTIFGGTTLRTFAIQTAAVNSQISTTIYARYSGVTKSQPLTLVPLIPTALSFTPSPVAGGATVVGRVVINGVAGPGGRTIAIFDNSAYSDVPSTVVVPPGGTDVTFNITTRRVPALHTVTVTARVSAGAKSATFRISPNTFAKMVRFDSTNDTIQLKGGTYDGACDLRGNFTVEAIIRPASVAAGLVWQQWHDGSMNEALIIEPADYYFIGTGAGSPDRTYMGTQLTSGVWVHLAWVYDGVTARVYKDGQLESSTPITGSICPLDTAMAACLGRNSGVYFTADAPFMGDLTAFRISKVARYSGNSFAPPRDPWANDADTLALFDPSLLTTMPTTFNLLGSANLVGNPGKGNGSATAPTLLDYTP